MGKYLQQKRASWAFPGGVIQDACLVLAALCLSLCRAGFLPVISLFAAWLLLRHWRFNWLPSALLVAYTSSAAAIVLTGASAPLAIAGVIAALGAWDQQHFHQQQTSANLPSEWGKTLEKHRLRSLVISLGLAVFFCGTGLSLHFKIPFGFIFGAVLVILLCLYCFGKLSDN